MGREELSRLADKLQESADLRALLVLDPQAAAQQAGVHLDEQDHQALRDMGVHEMDEAELETRVSKSAASM
jgi:hypothetical protein